MIAVTVPSRIRMTNTDSGDIRKLLTKYQIGSDGYQRIEKEHLEYVYKQEPRTALFNAETDNLIKKDYSTKETITDYYESSISHVEDCLIVANKQDRIRIEQELSKMKSANISIMEKLQYRAMKLSCFDTSMNSIWTFDVKNGILQRILNVDPKNKNKITSINELKNGHQLLQNNYYQKIT